MPSLTACGFRARARSALVITVVAAWAAASMGCKKRVTQAQCDELLDHYARFVVTEKTTNAPPEVVAAEQAREREEARSDDDFKNCTSELSTEDYACAIKAPSAAALLKCLE